MALKQDLDFQPQLLAKPEAHLDAELMATSLENRPAAGIQSASELAMRLAPAMCQAPWVILEENSLAEAIQLLRELATLERAKRRLLQDLGLPQMARRLARPRLPDLQLPSVEDSPVPSALALRYSPDPGPCASSLKILVVRKYSRAVRCGGRPICARCRPLSNRRALAGYDNKRSRWQRKHARRAPPFPIAASDRYRCLPRQIAD